MTWLALLFALVPPAVQSAIQAKYPGWVSAPVAPQISDWFREGHFQHEPNAIKADLDHDGADDYAVLLRQGEHQVLVVLLARGNRWETRELSIDQADPFTYLLLNEKGSRDFDFKTLRHFRHKRNSLVLVFFDKRPLVFVWSKSSFQKNVELNDEDE